MEENKGRQGHIAKDRATAVVEQNISQSFTDWKKKEPGVLTRTVQQQREKKKKEVQKNRTRTPSLLACSVEGWLADVRMIPGICVVWTILLFCCFVVVILKMEWNTVSTN